MRDGIEPGTTREMSTQKREKKITQSPQEGTKRNGKEQKERSGVFRQAGPSRVGRRRSEPSAENRGEWFLLLQFQLDFSSTRSGESQEEVGTGEREINERKT